MIVRERAYGKLICAYCDYAPQLGSIQLSPIWFGIFFPSWFSSKWKTMCILSLNFPQDVHLVLIEISLQWNMNVITVSMERLPYSSTSHLFLLTFLILKFVDIFQSQFFYAVTARHLLEEMNKKIVVKQLSNTRTRFVN